MGERGGNESFDKLEQETRAQAIKTVATLLQVGFHHFMSKYLI